jgi:hypothetical protein
MEALVSSLKLDEFEDLERDARVDDYAVTIQSFGKKEVLYRHCCRRERQ